MHTTPPADLRPKLRLGLAAEPHRDGNFILHDPLGIGRAVVISPLAVEVAERFDGESTVAEIVAGLVTEFPAAQVSVEVIAGLVDALDGASLLDSPALRSRFDGPVRKPSCVGSYSANPDELRNQLGRLFTGAGGPGLPTGTRSGGDRLRAVLAPHMDYGRGGVTYGHAFKELVEATDARVFVVVATSHYSAARFTLSRQHFDTPLGLVETDAAYVDRIVAEYGEGLFDDPLAHVPEHSIELEVVLLQHLLGGKRPFKIVPLLTGSIQDCVVGGADPSEADDVTRMVRAMREAEAACGEPVCYIISGDLAHIGPKFGDELRATGPWMDESKLKDDAILKSLESGRAADFYGVIAGERNNRRICGLAPTWLALEATRPKIGKVLHYQQYVHPQGKESVSFAAAAFYG